VDAHQAHTAWARGRNGSISYSGPDGMRDLVARKGSAELKLRQAIEEFTGEK
jgi:hypothetical protein